MDVLGIFLIFLTGLVVVAFGPLAILLLWPVFIPFLLIMFLLIGACFRSPNLNRKSSKNEFIPTEIPGEKMDARMKRQLAECNEWHRKHPAAS